MSNKLKIRVHERRIPHPSEDPINHRNRPAPNGYVNMFNSTMPVYVSKKIVPSLEHSLTYGDRKNDPVLFRYYNVLRGTFSDPIKMSYSDALELGLQRSKDMRYKNFEFYIDL